MMVCVRSRTRTGRRLRGRGPWGRVPLSWLSLHTARTAPESRRKLLHAPFGRQVWRVELLAVDGFRIQQGDAVLQADVRGTGLADRRYTKENEDREFLTREVKREWSDWDDEGRKRQRELSIRRTAAGGLWGTHLGLRNVFQWNKGNEEK